MDNSLTFGGGNTMKQFILALSLALLCGSVAFANNPHLVYSPLDGNVRLFPNETFINSFSLRSESQFSPVFDQTDLIASIFNIPALTDNSPDVISWVVPFEGVFGDRPEDQLGADLGNIFPTGMNQGELNILLTGNAWAGPGGTSGSFGLVLVPEPATAVLLTIGFVAFAYTHQLI